MLTPSYSELMRKINNDSAEDSQITSRYTIVLAVAKRARQIIDKANRQIDDINDRAVSMAVQEMSDGKIAINVEEDLFGESYGRMIASQMKYKNMSAASSDDLQDEFKENYDPAPYAKDEPMEFKEGMIETAKTSYMYPIKEETPDVDFENLDGDDESAL